MHQFFRNAAFLGLFAFTPAHAQEVLGDSIVPMPRPGDQIVLDIWNEPEMSDTFTINHNGYVALPRLGLRKVDEVSIAALEDTLRADLAEYLRNPSVQIQVLRRVFVLGEVREPGLYMADLTMGIPELIAMAGGATDAGDPRRVAVIREGQRVRYERGQQVFVTELLSGDEVVVGSENFFLRNPWGVITSAFTLITLIRQLGLF